MNSSHYPSLELCKKLTEEGFPEATSCHFRRNNSDIYEHTFWPWDDESYVCPSVMELLDEMPKLIHYWWIHYLTINWEWTGNWYFNCRYKPTYWEGKMFHNEAIPNALAEMWLWLKENNYLIK